MTARHCIPRDVAGLTLINASGTLPPTRLKSIRQGQGVIDYVPEDWAVLALVMTPGVTLKVVNSHMVPFDAPAEVTLLGLYPHALAADYYPVGSAHPMRSIRFPKPGLCEAISLSDNCLQLACQTVRGFSGTPIFSSRRPDGSYEVIGFVSGATGAQTGCDGNLPLTNSTYAVSSSVF